MKRLLKIEIVAIILLMIVAVFVSVGDRPDQPDVLQTEPPQPSTQPQTSARPETTAPTQTEPSVEVIATESTAPSVPLTEPTWMALPEDRELSAKEYFVYDCESESFTYLRGMELDRVYPASITKLFALYVALQHLDPTQTITAGDVLDLVGEGSSVAEIEKGNVK